jgi:hypothetical protein
MSVKWHKESIDAKQTSHKNPADSDSKNNISSNVVRNIQGVSKSSESQLEPKWHLCCWWSW